MPENEDKNPAPGSHQAAARTSGARAEATRTAKASVELADDDLEAVAGGVQPTAKASAGDVKPKAKAWKLKLKHSS